MKELADYRTFALLDAELHVEIPRWEEVRERFAERDRLKAAVPLPTTSDEVVAVHGFYWGMEELCGIYAIGAAQHWPFAHSAIDFIASELHCHTTITHLDNCLQLGAHFGPEIVGGVFDLIEAGLGTLRTEYRRAEVDDPDSDDGEEHLIHAPLDTEDDRFIESTYVKCDPTDEGATLITMIDLDMDAFQAIEEQVGEREKASRVARRQPTAKST